MGAARASKSGSILIVGALAALVLPMSPPTAWSDPPPAGSACTITGTAGPNTLNGTSGDDVICGRGGDDTIDGMGGDDLVIGGDGADTIEGGPGKDDLRGGPGADVITGGDADDVLYGGPDADDLDGGAGADRVLGDGGGDTLAGGDDADELRGDVGADTVNGGNGADEAFGGDDNDTVQGDLGVDHVVGGAGDDTVGGGDDNDDVRGGTGNDTLTGGAGDDVITDRDGSPYVDDVTCGTGTDVANVDFADTVDADCDSKRVIDREDPDAVDDTRTVNEDSSGTVLPVLNNDTDADGGPISITAVTQGTHGAVVQFPRKVTYTPDANYCNHPPSTTLDTFTYTLSPGGDTATVSVRVTCIDDAPVAVDDTKTVSEDVGAASIDVLGNDTDIDAGPISISAVTQPTDGTVVITNAGADLTYQPDANFCNNPPGTPLDSFDYTLAPGGDTGTVTVTVDCVTDPAVAADDADTVLEDAAATAVTVLGNDTPGDGGIVITGATDPANGTVAITGGGTGLTYQPDANYCNTPPGTPLDTFDYTVAPGGDTATVSMTVTCVNDNPLADDEAIVGAKAAIGNTVLVHNDTDDAAPSESGPKKVILGDLLDGDTDIDSAGPLTITAETVSSADGGTVVIEADGDFVFTPTCTDASDSFDYELNDGDGGTDTGTVSVEVSGCVWYVKNDAAPGGGGKSNAPYDTITEAETASGAGHTIFVYLGDGTNTGYGGDGLVLKNNQSLIGEHTGLTMGSDVLVDPSAFALPNLTATNADVVTMASGNTLSGVNLDPSGTGGGIAAGPGDNGGTFTQVQVLDGGTAGTEALVELAGVSGAWTFNGVTATNLAATGQTSGSIALRINNTTGSITFNPPVGPNPLEQNVFRALGAKGLDASSAQGVSGTINGVTSNGSTTGGISLSSVAGSGLHIGNPNLTTTGGTGFSAASSLPISTSNSASPNGQITSTGGRALSVQNTTIAAVGLNFSQINASGGDAGIVLDNTGSQGRLKVLNAVSGTCTIAVTSGCTGGTIANVVGVDDSSTLPVGTAISLRNTLGPNLTRVRINGATNYGIRGTNVDGFTMSQSVVHGTLGTSALTSHKDGAIRFEELTGTVFLSNTALSGGYFTNLMVDNTAGTLNATLANVDSLALDDTGGDDAVQFEGIGTADMNLDFSGSEVTDASGDLFQYIADGTGGGDLVLQGNTFTNNEPSIVTGGGGLAIVAGAKGAATLDVSGNTMRDSKTNAMTVIKSQDVAAGTNNLTATIAGNTIGVAGTANSGSLEGDGMEIVSFGDGNATFNVTSNSVHQYNSSGIEFIAGSGAANSGQVNLNISNNTVANPGTNPLITLLRGISVTSGTVAGDNYATCVDFGLNNITGSSDAPTKDFRLFAFQSGIRQPGYGGSPTDDTAFAAYAATQIGGGAQGTALRNVGLTWSGTGTACP